MQTLNAHSATTAIGQSATPQITGSTDVYFILGDPVEQVRAPEIFNLMFAQFGINAVLVPVQISPANLTDFVKTAFLAPNIKGLLVTIPHKTPMLSVLAKCSELGQLAGAVNSVRRNADGTLEGALFDGEGFAASLDYFGIAYQGKRVLIIGAGGGAGAIGASLALPGRSGDATSAASEVAFFDPVPGKAQSIATRIANGTGTRVVVALSSDPSGFDVIVNASPLGLKASDAIPVDVARMEPHAALVDIIMKNQPTPVVRAARTRGHNAQPGFEMMIQQAHLYLDFFGFPQAAQAVREDATALRLQVYPKTLQSEVFAVYRAPQRLTPIIDSVPTI